MKPEINESDKGLRVLICYCCGEPYSLGDFSKQNPLEVCGECGAEYFIFYSKDYLKGYTCLREHRELINMLPDRLSSELPPELHPQLSPFRN
jgi:hypothetical protein